MAALILVVAMAVIIYATRPFDRVVPADRRPTPSACGWTDTPYDLPALAGAASLVAGTSPQDLWIYERALDHGDPALLHFDRSTLQRVVLPGAIALEGMQAPEPNDLWAANGRTIWRFDGTSWTDLAVPANLASAFEPRSLEVSAPNDAWIGGTQRGAAVVLHWDGSSWASTYRPDPSYRLVSVESIDAWSRSDVWAVGFDRVGRFDAVPRAMHWDGASWTVLHNMMDREPGKAQHVAESVLATGPEQATVATSHGIYVWTGSGWSVPRSSWTVHDFPKDPQRYGWTLHPGATAIWGITNSMRGNDIIRWDGDAWESHRVTPERSRSGGPDLGGVWSYDMVTFGDTAVVVGGGGGPPFAIRVDC
jgi:hypothetical protein